MRVLPLCLLALLLTGCATHKAPPSPTDNQETKVQAPVAKPKPAPTARPKTVKLYNSAEELVGKPFRDLGEVSGADCQATAQDTPPSLPTARKRLQQRAAGLKANAVLLHDCQIVTGAPGCNQQAVCQGTALHVSAK